MTSRQLLKCLLAIRKRLYGFGIGRSQDVVPRLELIWFRVGGLRFKAFKIPGWKGSRSAQGLRVLCVIVPIDATDLASWFWPLN
jgi:hypothetical protein